MISKRIKFAAAIVIIHHLNENKTKRKKRSVWERNWIKRRNILGAYAGLARELRIEDPSQLRNFSRMSSEDFEELCS